MTTPPEPTPAHDPVEAVAHPDRPLNPACQVCLGRASLILDPVGEYDLLAWGETYACERHVGGLLVGLAEQLDEVRVTLVRVPAPAASDLLRAQDADRAERWSARD